MRSGRKQIMGDCEGGEVCQDSYITSHPSSIYGMVWYGRLSTAKRAKKKSAERTDGIRYSLPRALRDHLFKREMTTIWVLTWDVREREGRERWVVRID